MKVGDKVVIQHRWWKHRIGIVYNLMPNMVLVLMEYGGTNVLQSHCFNPWDIEAVNL